MKMNLFGNNTAGHGSVISQSVVQSFEHATKYSSVVTPPSSEANPNGGGCSGSGSTLNFNIFGSAQRQSSSGVSQINFDYTERLAYAIDQLATYVSTITGDSMEVTKPKTVQYLNENLNALGGFDEHCANSVADVTKAVLQTVANQVNAEQTAVVSYGTDTVADFPVAGESVKVTTPKTVKSISMPKEVFEVADATKQSDRLQALVDGVASLYAAKTKAAAAPVA